MKLTRGPLVIIPGLGDRVELYRLVTPAWKFLGYETYIFSFGWEDSKEDFAGAIKRLTDYIDNLQATRVNIIGVSAGGTAAVNALVLRPQVVGRVATIATPYEYLPHLKNEKLKASILELKRINKGIFRSNVLSVHGLYDQTVPVSASRPKGLRTLRVFIANHGVIIAVALTFCSLVIHRFVKK